MTTKRHDPWRRAARNCWTRLAFVRDGLPEAVQQQHLQQRLLALNTTEDQATAGDAAKYLHCEQVAEEEAVA